MTNLIANPIKQQNRTDRDGRRIYSFRADRQITHYLEKFVYDKSKFILRAIRFYLMLIHEPKKIMIELKRRSPELWKSVNRKKWS